MHEIQELPWYKQFWPWFIIALPSIMIVACLYLIGLSISNSDDLVNDDYYREGLAINQQLEKDIQARELDARATLMLGPERKQITVDLQGRFPRPPEKLQVELEHPTASIKDTRLTLVHGDDEYFRGNLETALEGRWYISLRGNNAEGKEFRLTGVLDLMISPSLVLVPKS